MCIHYCISGLKHIKQQQQKINKEKEKQLEQLYHFVMLPFFSQNLNAVLWCLPKASHSNSLPIWLYQLSMNDGSWFSAIEGSRVFSLGLLPFTHRNSSRWFNGLMIFSIAVGEIHKSIPIFIYAVDKLEILYPCLLPKNSLSSMMLSCQIIMTITYWHCLFEIASWLFLSFSLSYP